MITVSAYSFIYIYIYIYIEDTCFNLKVEEV